MSFIAPLLLVLAVSLISILFIVELISVPWPVLLLVLVVGLVATQRVLSRCKLS